MSKKRLKNKKNQKIIAKKRIMTLFDLAEKNALNHRFDLADRYVAIARKISMRYLVPIPIDFKKRFCKHCYSYLLPSVNSKVRINKGKIIISCGKCGKYTRIPIKNK